jgi:hypothetical protein
MIFAVAALILQASPADTVIARGTDTADTVPFVIPADAYVDPGAGELVRLARETRDATDRSITEYRTIATERISVGVRALRRDRTLFRRELAARIHWHRDSIGHVEVLGARQVAPMMFPVPKVPARATRDAAQLAFNPSKQLLLQGFGDGDGLKHPLADGSEADYRFATGDTTRIRLSGGTELRMVELRVVPRRQSGLLLQGSLWLDMDSHAAIRGVFRLSRPLDFTRDVRDEDDDDDDVPGILQPMEGDLRYLTIEYGLWDNRWWMPRLIALEGEGSFGKMLRVPVRFERGYDAYEVAGENTVPLAANEPAYPRRPPADSAGATKEGDSATIAVGSGGVTFSVTSTCDGKECWRYSTSSAPDTTLLASDQLPASIYSEDGLVITESEIRELADVLGIDVPGARPWQAPDIHFTYLRLDQMRYNRVEGLALAAAAEADFGPAQSDAVVWIGTADRQPNAELGVERSGFRAAHRVAAYRRLATVDPDIRALGLGSSLSALLLGRDDSDYYRAWGLELSGRPLAPMAWDYDWRLYAERQSTAENHTNFSAPHLLDDSRDFHENIIADQADQVGGELALGFHRGLDPRGLRFTADAGLRVEAGTFGFARPTVGMALGFPFLGDAVGAVEIAAGSAFGEVPVQALWYLGGPATVRGYGGASRISGDTFWRARGEIGTSLPFARLTTFSDAGWAGSSADLDIDLLLLSAGVGASLLDGLVRIDLARALRAPTGWRLDLYLDGII